MQKLGVRYQTLVPLPTTGPPLPKVTVLDTDHALESGLGRTELFSFTSGKVITE